MKLFKDSGVLILLAIAVGACAPAADTQVAQLTPISTTTSMQSTGSVDAQLAQLLFGTYDGNASLYGTQSFNLVVGSIVSNNRTYANIALSLPAANLNLNTPMGLVFRGYAASDRSVYVIALRSETLPTQLQPIIGSARGAIEVTLGYQLVNGYPQFVPAQSSIKIYRCTETSTTCSYPDSSVAFQFTSKR